MDRPQPHPPPLVCNCVNDGLKWKNLYEQEKKRSEELEREMKEWKRRVEMDRQIAMQDYQAQMMREGERVNVDLIERLIQMFDAVRKSWRDWRPSVGVEWVVLQ